jgi:ribosomal protein S18 acetylase RimI-like enzyme
MIEITEGRSISEVIKRHGAQLIQIIPIQKGHIKGFWRALDTVAREEMYLLLLKAPPIKKVRCFVLLNIKNKFTQYVVLDGDRIVGWCDIRPQGHLTTRHIGILAMGLLPEYRGRGIGAQLLKKCLGNAKKRGVEIVHLGVYASNKAAIRLYKEFGFSFEGLRKRARKHKGKYQDMFLMAKRLK